jgi:hypothetical protein
MFISSGFDIELTNRILGISGGLGHMISGRGSLCATLVKHPDNEMKNIDNKINTINSPGAP